jgi:TPP-dependent 2-oxoacid decarboxylase
MSALAKNLAGGSGAPAIRMERVIGTAAPKPRGNPSDPITVEAMYDRYRDFLRPNDQIVIENGSSSTGITALPLPEGAQIHSQSLWGSIGWATCGGCGSPAAFTSMTAHWSRCPIRWRIRAPTRNPSVRSLAWAFPWRELQGAARRGGFW